MLPQWRENTLFTKRQPPADGSGTELYGPRLQAESPAYPVAGELAVTSPGRYGEVGRAGRIDI